MKSNSRTRHVYRISVLIGTHARTHTYTHTNTNTQTYTRTLLIRNVHELSDIRTQIHIQNIQNTGISVTNQRQRTRSRKDGALCRKLSRTLRWAAAPLGQRGRTLLHYLRLCFYLCTFVDNYHELYSHELSDEQPRRWVSEVTSYYSLLQYLVLCFNVYRSPFDGVLCRNLSTNSNITNLIPTNSVISSCATGSSRSNSLPHYLRLSFRFCTFVDNYHELYSHEQQPRHWVSEMTSITALFKALLSFWHICRHLSRTLFSRTLWSAAAPLGGSWSDIYIYIHILWGGYD